MRLRTLLIALFAVSLSAEDVKIRVDASDAPRRLFHVRMAMPVKSGPLTLAYPIRAGETWSYTVEGLPFAGMALELTS